MKIKLLILGFIFSISVSAQVEYIEYLYPAEKGDVETILLTKEGYKKLNTNQETDCSCDQVTEQLQELKDFLITENKKSLAIQEKQLDVLISLENDVKKLNALNEKIADRVEKIQSSETGQPELSGKKYDAYGNQCLNDEDEKMYVKNKFTKPEQIASAYNKSNDNRRCRSTKKLGLLFGVGDWGSEIKIATRVFEAAKKL